MVNIYLTTTATIPSGSSITVYVYEDISGSSNSDVTDADNSNSTTISDGTNTNTLSGFSGGTGNSYFLIAEYTPGSAASLDSATLDTDSIRTVIISETVTELKK